MICKFNTGLLLFYLFVNASGQFLTYEIPRPRITVFSPRGLRFLIPHEEGMTRGVLLANINTPLGLADNTAAIVKEVRLPRNNRWIFFNAETILKVGDIINYKIAVEFKGKYVYSGPNSFRVNAVTPLPNQPAGAGEVIWPGVELSAAPPTQSAVPPPRPPAAANRPGANKPPPAALVVAPTTKRPAAANAGNAPCRTVSSTLVKGKAACKGALVFQEHFDSLDANVWKHAVLIPDAPDFEFCMYDKRKENSFVKDGILHIQPTLTEAAYGKSFIMNGTLTLPECTASIKDECSHRANFGYIMPPVISSRLGSAPHFSFKYGRVEVKAKMALGDWLLSGIYLQPVKNTYGARYDSGQVRLGMSRGNRDLQCDEVETGISQVESGIILSNGEDNLLRLLSSRELNNGQGWDQSFHVFRADWTADKIVIQIDGKIINTIMAPAKGFGSFEEFSEETHDPWKTGTKLAPFDQEFFVSFGVGVGGIHDFPDNCVNNNEHKPWSNGQPKAKLNFWKQQAKWHPTWDLKDGAMQIDYVKVYAL